MKAAPLLLLCAFGLLPLRGEENIIKFSRLKTLSVDDENATGKTCRVRGVVSHVSGIRTNLFVLAAIDTPYRAGIPVELPSGMESPDEGDDVWVKGTTAEISGQIGIAAVDIAVVSSFGDDFARQLKWVDFRKGHLDWRRVWLRGTVANISEKGDVTVLTIRDLSGGIHIRVPGKIDGSIQGEKVRIVGCVFPVEGGRGEVLGRVVEVAKAEDVVRLTKDYTPVAVAVLCTALSVAFLVAFVAWVRARREKLKMAAVMEERKRMAHDLHDTIEQHLATVRLLLGGIVNLKDLDTRVSEPLRHASQVLANAKSEVRDAVLNLRSDEALEKTPTDALKELAYSVNAAGAARVRTALRGLPDSLPQGRFQDLLLIVREAVTNAMKHGGAKNIVLAADPGWTLRILNDGEPFDAATALGPETGHFGLSGMRERADRSGFAISFGTQGRWTAVTICT